MLAKQAKSYLAVLGLQEPQMRDGNYELYKPDLIFVKGEGRAWVPTWDLSPLS